MFAVTATTTYEQIQEQLFYFNCWTDGDYALEANLADQPELINKIQTELNARFNNPTAEQRQLLSTFNEFDTCATLYGYVPTQLINNDDSFDPKHEDKRKKYESQRFNRRQFKQFNEFGFYFVDYNACPQAYTDLKINNRVVRGLKIQTSLPYSIYNTKTNKYLTIGYSSNYPSVTVPGFKKSQRIHRIVACMFIPNTHNKRIVDHIYGNHNDWRLTSLRWATDKENGKNKHRRTDLAKFQQLPSNAVAITSYTTISGQHTTTHTFKQDKYYYLPDQRILLNHLKNGSYREINTNDGNACVLDAVEMHTTKSGKRAHVRVWVAINVLHLMFLGQR